MSNPDILKFVRLPARLNVEQVAALLNCHPDSIQILVQRKLLTPLGKPNHNATKFFATQRIEELIKDEGFLDAATDAIYRAVKLKNKNAPPRVSFSSHAEAA